MPIHKKGDKTDVIIIVDITSINFILNFVEYLSFKRIPSSWMLCRVTHKLLAYAEDTNLLGNNT
jgi:hypothetical protein